MRKTRLAAAGAAGIASVALMATPAFADQPRMSVSPDRFSPGETLKITITGCETKPTDFTDKNNLFVGEPSWTKAGDKYTDSLKTTNFTPGKTYTVTVTCMADGKKVTFGGGLNPKPEEDPKPKFDFGYDDVKLSTRTVKPGSSTTWTITCPVKPVLTGNGFAKVAVKKTGEKTWKANTTFKSSSLPDPTTAKIVCKGFGKVTFSTSPEKGGMKEDPKKVDKIPSGVVKSGDGSTAGDTSAMPMAGAGALAVVAAAGLGTVLTRRRAGERS